MALLYAGTAVSGYNANPPPDDGTQVPTNQVTWAGIKSKLGDPLNTFSSSVDTNLTAAFGKTTDGAAVLSITTNYTVGAADQGKLIKVTSSGVTITTPDAGSVNAPFMFHVLNLSTGTITLAGNATNSQTIDSQTSQVIQPGSGAAIKTDGTNWFSFGLKAPQITTGGASFGFNAPINLSLNASVASNLLTVAVKTVAGNDPSAGDPVLIPFRDVTVANGDPVWITVNSALNISTNATGATLGTQNNVPFRFWIVAFNNGGTVVLALWHSGAGASSPLISQLVEGALQSTTGISAAATSAGVFYTPNGTSLSSKAFRILGYLEYGSGLTTAGTYASTPTVLQLFGPGIKKPGDIIQAAYFATNSASSVTNNTTPQASNIALAIVPSSAINLIRVTGTANCHVASGGSSPTLIDVEPYRGSTGIGTLGAVGPGLSSSSSFGNYPFDVLDNPYSATSTTYTVKYNSSVAASGGTVSVDGGTITLTEIMG